MNNFNSIAPIYDKLCYLVFGRGMHKAQTCFLEDIMPAGTVLILGGGTGWILAELMLTNKKCNVWYIDPSSKMLELSKNKFKDASPQIVFIRGTQTDIPPGMTFDAVITHCYLDLFTSEECNAVVHRIKGAMHAKSAWLITDFISTAWWHNALLSVMYAFFKVVCEIQAEALPPWRTLVERNGFSVTKEKRFFGGFISSMLIRRK